MTTKLQEMAKMAYDTSKKIIEEKGGGEELTPAFLALMPDESITIMLCPIFHEEAKEAISQLLRMKFKELGVLAYIHVSEAWQVSYGPNEERPNIEPSKSERRKEVVIIAGQHISGETFTSSIDILRDDNNVRSLAPFEVDPDIKPSGGRFATLLGEINENDHTTH